MICHVWLSNEGVLCQTAWWQRNYDCALTNLLFLVLKCILTLKTLCWFHRLCIIYMLARVRSFYDLD